MTQQQHFHSAYTPENSHFEHKVIELFLVQVLIFQGICNMLANSNQVNLPHPTILFHRIPMKNQRCSYKTFREFEFTQQLIFRASILPKIFHVKKCPVNMRQISGIVLLKTHLIKLQGIWRFLGG